MKNNQFFNELIIQKARVIVGVLLILLHANAFAADETRKNSIKIEVTTHLGNKQTFKEGDILSFLVTLDQDAYLLMIYEDAKNNLVQVIPNRYRSSNHYRAGLFISVPNRDEPFRFVISPPFGRETLWVFAADEPFPELEGTSFDNGLKKLTDKRSTIFSKIRNIASRTLYGEANTTIFTER